MSASTSAPRQADRPRSIYLINPVSYCASYYNLEVFRAQGHPAAVIQGELALTTVAAMVPPDFEVRLCDENISPVDMDTDASFVGITGKMSQGARMIELARAFRRLGKVVLFGGPYASLSPDAVREHCDILVRGELEGIAGRLFDDLRSGQWQPEYLGEKADLAQSPVPRWDLYPNDRALLAGLQTSRGCPFDCEFCDVIQYLGRKQRHKPVDLVLRELDQLHGLGYRVVFLADDNFTAYRARTRELLAALAAWNAQRGDGHMRFYTQLSIDAARDDDLLRQCAEARLNYVYIGIETPNEESLRETRKRQNLKVDLVAQLKRFLDHGIAVSAGMICGFDHDGLDIFERQYEFAMATGVPIWTITALMAPETTPLYERMARDGRLLETGSQAILSVLDTNFMPLNMSGHQLSEGIRWLCNRLYHPQAFGERMLRFIADFKGRPEPPQRVRQPLRAVEAEAAAIVLSLADQGPEEHRLWSRIAAALPGNPEATPFVMSMLLQYMQIRLMYQQGHFWEPALAAQPAPAAAAVQAIAMPRPRAAT